MGGSGLKTAEEKTIWDEKDSKTAHRFIWAPEIHEIGGKWYSFFAASGSSDNVWDINCHAIVCKGKDPYDDTWEDLGKMKYPDDDDFSEVIDGETCSHDIAMPPPGREAVEQAAQNAPGS